MDVCPTCSVYDTEAVEHIVPHEKRIQECDTVVCGGGAGLITAVKLAREGQKVILLEKAKVVGGDMNLAHAFFPVYSKVHKEAGLEDVREAAVEELSRRANYEIPRPLIETAVYATVDFMDWLLDFPKARELFPLQKFGEKRSQGPIYGEAIFGFPKRIENENSKDPSIGPGWMGTYIKNAMLDAIRSEKLPVEILLETPAKQLLTGESGEVCGVLAADPGGEIEIHASNVVLFTGGYGASDEKLQKYFGFFDDDRPIMRFTVPSNTGDALDMLEELGVAPDAEHMFVSFFGPAHHPFHYSLYRLLDHPSTLAVDLNGKRIFDESLGLHGAYPAIKKHPKQVMWGIYSQKNVDDIMEEYLSDPTLADEYDCYADYQKDLEVEAAYKVPPVIMADTLDELAWKLKIPVAELLETVSEYNRFCESGIDKEFGKDAVHLRTREIGPWYAVYGQMFSECSAGGVSVNEKCQVLRNDGTVISGLYAGGNTTSAMHRRDKLAVVSELTWAVASAYRCAQEILDSE